MKFDIIDICSPQKILKIIFFIHSSSEKLNSIATPLKPIHYNNNELENLSKRKSATKRHNRPDSPIPQTPTKTPKRSSKQYGTPNQENITIGTPKSILKSFSIRLNRCKYFMFR